MEVADDSSVEVAAENFAEDIPEMGHENNFAGLAVEIRDAVACYEIVD